MEEQGGREGGAGDGVIYSLASYEKETNENSKDSKPLNSGVFFLLILFHFQINCYRNKEREQEQEQSGTQRQTKGGSYSQRQTDRQTKKESLIFHCRCHLRFVDFPHRL